MKLENIRKEFEYLKENNLSILDLMIYDELDCQLEEKLSDDEFIKLMGYIENAYCKADGVSLWAITKFCIENKNKLENICTCEIVNGAFSYDY